MNHLLRLAVAALAAHGTPAQNPVIGGDWYVRTVPLWVFVADENWQPVQFPGPGLEAGSLSVTGSGSIIGNAGACGGGGIARWDAGPGSCVSGLVGTRITDANATVVAALRRGVLIGDANNQIALVDPNGFVPTPTWRTLPGSQCAAVATNGREIVTIIQTGGLRIYDIENPQLAGRPLAANPIGNLVIRNRFEVICMELGVGLTATDMNSGISRVVAGFPPTRTPSAGDRFRVAYDPWSDTIVVAPTWTTLIGQVWALPMTPQGQGWSQVYSQIFVDVKFVETLLPRPYEVYGQGCVNGLGLEPRMNWIGVPRQGARFSVNVRDTEPNALVSFWLGASDQSWTGVGGLPLDAGRLGAPGCTLYASADEWYPAVANANGTASASLSVPLNPALYGLEFFMQSASTSSANAAGLAVSDALLIRVR